MLKRGFCLIVLLCLLFSTAAAESDSHHLAVRTVKWLLSQDMEYTIVDAREPEYYEDSHIPGAINIPLSELASKATGKLPDKERIIVVYCFTAPRSKEAAGILADLGYTEVYEFGGFISWTGNTEGNAVEEEYDDDPFEAKEYGNPDDFYYDFYEEFDDYEEAEEYYYEHGGW